MARFQRYSSHFTRVALSLGVAGAVGLAAQAGFGVTAVSAAPPDGLPLAESQLTGIEATFARIEKTEAGPARDELAAPLEAQQQKYANVMLERYFAVVKQARTSVAGVKAFEDVAKRHEARLSALNARAQRLRPPGQAMLTAPVYLARQSASWGIGDLFVAPAHAAIALSVYTACNQKKPTLCALAVAKAAKDGAEARAAFNACWARYENRKPNWLRAALRVGCTVSLIIKLA